MSPSLACQEAKLTFFVHLICRINASGMDGKIPADGFAITIPELMKGV
jgi:hypothetical protein